MRQLAAKMGIAQRIENLKNYYARLSEREQVIFNLSCAGGGIALLILIYSILLGWNAAVSSKINNNRKNLEKIVDFGEKYHALEQKIGEIDQMIGQTPANFQLATELEMLAQQNRIQIKSIKGGAGKPHEFYTETQAAIELQGVQLLQLIDFLFAIENSEKLMRISTLQIKPNYKDVKMLDANFIVSTFQHQS